MSLKDVFDSATAAVGGMIPAEAADPATLREPVLALIKQAEDRWARPAVDEPADWFSQDGDLVAFSPKLANGAPLTINGQTTVFVPADRFADYLVNMRGEVEAGSFDRQIAAGMGGSANVSGLASVPMPEARTGTSEEVREEQRAEALERDGRHPDGSVIRAGEHSDA